MNKKNNKHFGVFIATIIAVFILIATFSQDVANNVTLGLDLQGGFEILYEVSPLDEGGSIPDMSVVANSVSKRVNVLGVSEPQIIIEGEDRIRVQLAGVSDQDAARRIISSTANLTFRDVNDNLLADGVIVKEGGASLSYENGVPLVSLKIEDSAKFAQITGDVAKMSSGNNLIVAWLDFEEGVDSYRAEAEKDKNGEEAKYISAASVSEAINGDCVIRGNFTDEEARELANLVNSGSLPVKMTELHSNVVSADYGIGAFELTARAGMIGVLLVALFMMFIYRLPGIISVVMLGLYIFAVFAIYGLMGGVFTLPGIAALVLGVGMTVDANIITFERIKDELYLGRSVKKAVAEGQKSSFVTIFDAQFTTLLAGIIMYVFGTGSVKGFATMLMVTVFCTLILNVTVSRFLLTQITKSGRLDDKKQWFGVKLSNIPNVSKKEEQFYFGPFKSFDFIGKAKYSILASVCILGLAVVMMLFNTMSSNGPLNLGIDFSSGTKITVTSNETIVMDDVKSTMDTLGFTVSKYQQSGDQVVYITIKDALDQDELSVIKDEFTAQYGIEPNDNVVTPVVGRELVQSAVLLSLLAWVVMLIYITLRFKLDYAVSCIIALVHDVLIVLAIFAIFRMEVNIELISVALAIIGYSINNSIVVFDRIRETVSNTSKPHLTNVDYKNIVNQSIDKTFIRSVYSSITTIIPVICLLLIGSGAIFTFNFAMFIGLIAGTLSSIFVAPYVWYYIRCNYKPKAKIVKHDKKEALDEITIKGINA